MAVVKAVRVRPADANVDQRLGEFKSPTGLKGSLGDVKVTIEDDGNKWKVSWLAISDINSSFVQEFKKKDWENYSPDNIIFETMRIAGTRDITKITGGISVGITPDNFYNVVQDPWQDNPPKKRSYGIDPYYLNNGAKISIIWMIGSKTAIPGVTIYDGTPEGSGTFDYNNIKQPGDWIGGPIWSNDQGEELMGTPARDQNLEIIPDTFVRSLSRGRWLNPATGQIEVYLTDEIKKYVLIESPELTSSPDPKEKFTVTSEFVSDFKKVDGNYSKPNEWGVPINFMVKDKEIIAGIIQTWEKKVPEYGKPADPNKRLSLCKPDFYSAYVDIKYASPLFNSGEKDPQGQSASQVIEAEKLQLNVKLPATLNVKAGIDMPTFQVYVGEIPETDPDNIFTDEIEEFLQEDDEFVESAFEGQSEDLNEIQGYISEEIKKETKENAQKINNEPFVQGKWDLDLIPGTLQDNDKNELTCCVIDGCPVNVKIANAVLDLKAAAKQAGHNVVVNSGFRPAFGTGYNGKSSKGTKVRASSQVELWRDNCGGVYPQKSRPCSPATAPPGNSRHGDGIAIDFNTGSRCAPKISKLKPELYAWMIKNSWKFGFVRVVASEEWHFEYWPEAAKNGPYGKLKAVESGQSKCYGWNLYYEDLGLNNLTI